MGNIVEADYFFQLCERHKKDLSQKQSEILGFQKFKRDYLKGLISYEEMTHHLNDMRGEVSSTENVIYIEINLLNLELIKKAGERDFDTSILEKAENLFKRIDLEIPKGNTKHLQKVFLTEIVARILGRILMDFLVDEKINQSAGLSINSKYQTQVHQKVTTLNSKCHSILIEALRFAEENDNKLLWPMYI